jgi:MSHA biogenesis protein MshK
VAERLTAAVLAVALLGAACAARAQALADPTRPPTVMASPAGADGMGSRGPRLQSVLISGTRKLAMIDGVTVALGDRFDGATVVAIAETEVKLRQGESVQTLKLYPGIERQPVESATANNKENRP